jgi:hypothetical protein
MGREEELLVLRKTLTELLDKEFIRASNPPAAGTIRKPMVRQNA